MSVTLYCRAVPHTYYINDSQIYSVKAFVRQLRKQAKQYGYTSASFYWRKSNFKLQHYRVSI